MSRPTRINIDSGAQSWEAVVNSNFQQVFDRPFAVLVFEGTLAELELARPAASYEWCLAIVEYDGESTGNALAFSDGTAWRLASNWQLLNRHAIASSDSNVTVDDSHDVIITTSNDSQTVTLPEPTAANEGRRVRIKHRGEGTVTVASAGSGATIDGAADFAIATQYSSFEFVSDGVSDWMVF